MAGSARVAKGRVGRERRMENIERLAKPSVRQEVVGTPGPYDCRRRPYEDRKIPMTIGGDSAAKGRAAHGIGPASNNVPESAPVNYAAVEGKPYAATFSLEPRFGWTSVLQERRLQKDGGAAGSRVTEQSYAAVEPKPFAVSFSLAGTQSAFPKDPLLLRGTLGPAPGKYSTKHGTIEEFIVKNHGGVISTEPRSMNWATQSASPGPIYNPNYAAVEPINKGVQFSTNPRLPGMKEKTTPGPFRYADGALKALDTLSTNKRVPNSVFSSCPSASEMPFPYNTANFCNSGSMRTLMKGPAFQEARKQTEAAERRRMKFWKGRAQPSDVRPHSAPTGTAAALGVVGRPATAPPKFASTQSKLKAMQKNPLQAIMRIAERGYEISSIMRSMYGREAAASDAEASAAAPADETPSPEAAVGKGDGSPSTPSPFKHDDRSDDGGGDNNPANRTMEA